MFRGAVFPDTVYMRDLSVQKADVCDTYMENEVTTMIRIRYNTKKISAEHNTKESEDTEPVVASLLTFKMKLSSG